MAAAVRGGQVAGVILHTDQGSEDTAGFFRAACDWMQIQQSMSRPGSALEFDLRSLEDFAARGRQGPGGCLDR
jgi:transposase InsO family protein